MAMLNTGEGRNAALLQSCFPDPTATNPGQVICGGSRFASRAGAAAWPGAGMTENAPTIENRLYAQYMLPRHFGPPQAATPDHAKGGYAALSPITLVAPMPSITPPNPVTNQSGGQQVVSSAQVTGAGGALCSISNWAAQSPGMALGVALGVYWLLRRG